MNLSYSQKLRNELINNKEISNFTNKTNKNISNNISLLDDKELSYFLSDNNYINSAINKNSKIKKINTTNTTSVQSKNKMRIKPIYIQINKTTLLPNSFRCNNAVISAGTSQNTI